MTDNGGGGGGGATSFNMFYVAWLDKLHHLVTELKSAPKPPTTQEDLTNLTQLVQKVLGHYEEYYRVKSAAAERDVLTMFSAPWASSLERSLHWIAGWRPTTLFHLVYTESSIQFESRIFEILRGRNTGDLGDLSPAQFRTMSELQCETVREENAITNMLAEWQEGPSDLVRFCTGRHDLRCKVVLLVEIMHKADDLRLRTIMRVVEMLSPQQAVEFLSIAAQLQFGVRALGKTQDPPQRNASSSSSIVTSE